MKETLEEAAKKYSENWEEITGLDYENSIPFEVNKIDFINGAKWQSERMYSDLELEVAFFEGRENKLSFKEWFSQFKKGQ